MSGERTIVDTIPSRHGDTIIERRLVDREGNCSRVDIVMFTPDGPGAEFLDLEGEARECILR